jgi:hypothetical protein
MKMDTTNNNAMLQVQSAVSQIRSGRAILGKVFPELNEMKLAMIESIIAGNVTSLVEDVALPDVVSTKPRVSNVERSVVNGGGNGAPRIIDGRPSLPWAIKLI